MLGAPKQQRLPLNLRNGVDRRWSRLRFYLPLVELSANRKLSGFHGGISPVKSASPQEIKHWRDARLSGLDHQW